MTHKVTKFFGFWQHEREEVWLNEMSAKGLNLVSVGWATYYFEESSRSEYTYRLELLSGWLRNAENTAYIQFLEETGIEHVATIGRWAYFRKKASDDPFEIYSDNTSKIKHYWRIIQMIIFLGLANTLQIPNTITRILDHYDYGDSTFLVVLLAIQMLLTGILAVGVTSLHRKIRKLKRDAKLRE